MSLEDKPVYVVQYERYDDEYQDEAYILKIVGDRFCYYNLADQVWRPWYSLEDYYGDTRAEHSVSTMQEAVEYIINEATSEGDERLAREWLSVI